MVRQIQEAPAQLIPEATLSDDFMDGPALLSLRIRSLLVYCQEERGVLLHTEPLVSRRPSNALELTSTRNSRQTSLSAG